MLSGSVGNSAFWRYSTSSLLRCRDCRFFLVGWCDMDARDVLETWQLLLSREFHPYADGGGGVIGYATEYVQSIYSDCCAAVKSMLVVKFVCILEVCHNPRTHCILYGVLYFICLIKIYRHWLARLFQLLFSELYLSYILAMYGLCPWSLTRMPYSVRPWSTVHHTLNVQIRFASKTRWSARMMSCHPTGSLTGYDVIVVGIVWNIVRGK